MEGYFVSVFSTLKSMSFRFTVKFLWGFMYGTRH